METAALDNIKKIAEFRDGEGELDLPPASKMRRGVQHCIAANMGGLKTVGVGEGGNRHVVVSL
jgi:predicted RNA-binding protein Jag